MCELGFNIHPKGLNESNISAWNLTYSLIYFCKSHDYSFCKTELSQCLSAIAENDRETAKKIAIKIPLGGMGCFNDVFIQAIVPHEVEVTAQTCFEALLSCWHKELVKD